MLPEGFFEKGAEKALELLLCEDEYEAIDIAMDLKILMSKETIMQESLAKAEEYIERNGLLTDKVFGAFLFRIFRRGWLGWLPGN